MDELRHQWFRLVKRLYDLRSGLIFVPGVLIAVLMLAAVALVWLDAVWLQQDEALGVLRAALAADSVRTILVTMAAAMMTAVATLFSVLLVVQTLASQQFSPRIVGSLVRDRTSQVTLGITLGNVVFCFVVLLGVRDAPPFVPTLAVLVAAVLFLAGLGILVNFIHHVSQIVQINYIVDGIAGATETAIDTALPAALAPGEEPDPRTPAPPPADSAVLESRSSGYIQGVDLRWLNQVAAHHGVSLRVLLRVGDFATRSVALVAVSPASGLSRALASQVLDGFHIGPVRTIRQDPDFGFRQLSDVALKAISPAVNDPTTALTCLRHIGRLLVRAVGRHNPYVDHPEHGPTPRVYLPAPHFVTLLDHGLVQIRQYSRADFAVSLGLLQVLRDLARETRCSAYLDRIVDHADDVHASRSETAFAPSDRAHIDRAWREVHETADRQRAHLGLALDVDATHPVSGA